MIQNQLQKRANGKQHQDAEEAEEVGEQSKRLQNKRQDMLICRDLQHIQFCRSQ